MAVPYFVHMNIIKRCGARYLSLFLVDIEGFSLGHVEAPLNVNEKQLVEALLTRVLGECMDMKLLAADSQFEYQAVFDLLVSLKIDYIIA